MSLLLLASPVTSQRALVVFKSKTQMVLGLSSLLSLSLSSSRIAAPSAAEGTGSRLLKGKKSE